MYARHLALGVLLAVLLVVASAVTAGEGDPNFTLDCDGFNSAGGAIVLNRDNTGTRREVFVISAIDGAGNMIYNPNYDDFFVGTTVSIEAGAGGTWTHRPRYNPLTLQVISPAGNGLDAQLIADVTGSCEGLPTVGRIENANDMAAVDTMAAAVGEDGIIIFPADGVTSDPVELNTPPPRPVNPLGLVQSQAGYAIVNTDNLSLRTGDGPRYEKVGVLDGGTELIVLGRNNDRSWWYVQVGGLRGWVSSEFLVMRGNLTDVPVVPVTGQFTLPNLYVGYSGNAVYELPLPGAAVACYIPGNLMYPILGRTSSTAWYEIEATCNGELSDVWIPAELGIVRNEGDVGIPVTSR